MSADFVAGETVRLVLLQYGRVYDDAVIQDVNGRGANAYARVRAGGRLYRVKLNSSFLQKRIEKAP